MSQEEQLYTLMAVAEQQQKEIQQAIEGLSQTKQQLLELTSLQTQKSVNQAVHNGLQDGTAQLKSTAKYIDQLEQRLHSTTNRLSWKYITIGLGIFACLMFSTMLFLTVFMPSLDEIQQRRADVAKLAPYALQLRENNGTTLVRIMTKKPCYSYQPSNVKDKVYDWCEIDTKRY